ncbi:PAS domain S-box protein [Larkinella harenae]
MALKRYHILDTLPEKEFDQLTELASVICDVPTALISLIDEQRQWFKSSYNFEDRQTHRDIAFCGHTILQDDILEVKDALQDNRFRQNPLVLGKPHIRFYAGHPLTDPAGFNLGSICVIDQKPGKLTKSQKKNLKILADIAVGLIVKHREKLELQQFKQLFELSNDLLCVAGTDGFFKEINPAFRRVLGWDETVLLRTSIFDLVHPEDLPAIREEIFRLAQGQQSINFEPRFRCQDGSYRNLQWVATPDTTTGLIYAIARDITLEKEKEAALQYSENRFRSFFEHSQGFMCLHDQNGRFLRVNQAGARSMGYEPEDFTQLTLFDISPAQWHEQVKDYLFGIQQHGQASGLMYTLHRNGTTQIWYFNNILEVDSQQQPYVIGNAIDITERHKLELELKKASEMLEQTNRVAKIGGWEVDLVRETVSWSSVTKAIHGVAEEYVPNFDAAVSFFKEPYRAQIVEIFQRAVTEGVSYDVELQVFTATDRPVWVRVIGKPEFKNGKCVRVFGTFQDIDDRKKAEKELLTEKKRLAAFVEHAPAAVAMFDKDIRYLAVSKRWLEEYKITQDIIGLSHYEVFPNITDSWKNIHQRCLQGEVEKCEEDIWQPPDWNYEQHLRWEVRPWYEYDGKIGGIMMFTQDITEICLQREELKRAKLLAENASKAKSEFLANMSHEIRTPLNGVIGFTDLVLKTELDTTQQQYLSIVNQSANALLSIINDILDFSKIEAGKLELDVTRSDIYEISSQVSDIITYQVQNKGLEMLLNLPPNLPRFVSVDAVRLKQVLINLLGNAVKFTEQGEIELKITAQQRELGLALFRFEVRDTGIGIKPEMQAKIFEAFSQEDPSTTKKYGGTGLGLTISNKLLGLMGSHLQLDSQPGKGSTFYFELPLKAQEGDPIVWQDVRSVRNVLIVDDNENNRIILRQMFFMKQIQVEEASNGFEALNILAAGKTFDAILMDYHMPFMNGLETVEKIRGHFAKSPDIQPVVLLHSSSDDGEILKGCEQLHIRQRLVKPIKMQELYFALSRLKETENETRPPQKASVSNQPAAKLPVKILIVEDNKINQLLAKSILKRIVPDAILLEALNGQEAVEYYSAEKPDLILMDVQMPVMNGIEATRQIRGLEHNSHVLIVALTASSTVEEKQKCVEAGMDDFIAKPIVEDSLVQVFSRWKVGAEKEAESDLQPVLVDISVIERLAGNDPELTEELVQAAKDELNGWLTDRFPKLLEGDLGFVKSAGHRLYGTTISAGMDSLSERARQLEYLEKFDFQIVAALGEQIKALIHAVIEQLSLYQNQKKRTT